MTFHDRLLINLSNTKWLDQIYNDKVTKGDILSMFLMIKYLDSINDVSTISPIELYNVFKFSTLENNIF